MIETTSFFVNIEENFKRGLELIKKKNADYATGADPFKNFRAAELLGMSVEQGMLIRMSDKLARVANLLDKESKVISESKEDTLLDLMNYANLLLVYMRQKSLNDLQKIKDNLKPIEIKKIS